MDFIFCKIKNKELPSNILYEDDLVMVIMDVNPTVDGHSLIIPKKHYTDYLELDNETLCHIFDVAREIAPKIMEKLEAKSTTLLVNYGDDQKVKHFHLHILPDYLDNVKTGPKNTTKDNFQILSK